MQAPVVGQGPYGLIHIFVVPPFLQKVLTNFWERIFFLDFSKKKRRHKYVRTSCRRVQNLEEKPPLWHIARRLNHVFAEAPALHIHLD